MDPDELSVTFINKIPHGDSIRNLIIKSRWQPDDVSLQILNISDSTEWSGRITHDELKQSAEELEILFEEFFDECKEALTTNGGLSRFLYSLEDDKFTLVKDDEFRMQYLEVDVRHASGVRGSVTEGAAELIAILRSQLLEAQQESKKLNQKYQDIATTLDRCLDEKNLIERKLLRKFSVLLNTKKDKIAEMQDLLLEKNKKIDEVGVNHASSSKRKSTEMRAESMDGNGADDDDFMQITQPLTQPVMNLPKRKKLQTQNSITAVRISLSGRNSTNAQLDQANADNVDTDTIEDIFDQL